MNVQKCNICVLFQQLVTSGVSYYRHSAVAQMVILLSATISLEHLTKLFIYCVTDSDGLFFVLFQFFETVVRYDRFFSSQSQHIPTVLVRFVLLLQK